MTRNGIAALDQFDAHARLEEARRKLHAEVKAIESAVDELAESELEREMQRLRAELPQLWPALAGVLQKVEQEDRIRAHDWLDKQLEREAYLALVRFRAVRRRVQELASGTNP